MSTMNTIAFACFLSILTIVPACGEATSAQPSTPPSKASPSAPESPAATPADPAASTKSTPMPIEIKKDKIEKSEQEWKSVLSPEQFYVLRKKGTERAFTGKYWNTKEPGVYRCAGCEQPLFTSTDKFDAHCGWPSFDKPFADGIIAEHVDTTHGMVRTEVTCARCGAHLGHVFNDGPTRTGLRYCINSASIDHQQMETPPSSTGKLADQPAAKP